MTDIQGRKREHMELAGSDASQGNTSALWEEIELIPRSLPELSFDEIDVTTEFLGRQFAAPIVIAGMTGGHEEASRVNANLANAASKLGLAIGTGSQRAALLDPALAPTYSIVRETAPEAYVIGNLGMCQLVPQGAEPPFGSDEIDRAVEMVRADALAIHLNAVEELIQTEGDRNMAGILDALQNVVARAAVPVIAKETGAGVSRESAEQLSRAGVEAIDVGGVGGTSFARIEGTRAQGVGDERGSRLGAVFGDWGLPTALSIAEVAEVGLPVIATGGVRTGLHAAKALALGATMIGIGGPAIRAAMLGVQEVIDELTMIIEELKVTMALVGARDIQTLRSLEPIPLGRAAEWVRARGLTI